MSRTAAPPTAAASPPPGAGVGRAAARPATAVPAPSGADVSRVAAPSPAAASPQPDAGVGRAAARPADAVLTPSVADPDRVSAWSTVGQQTSQLGHSPSQPQPLLLHPQVTGDERIPPSPFTCSEARRQAPHPLFSPTTLINLSNIFVILMQSPAAFLEPQCLTF